MSAPLIQRKQLENLHKSRQFQIMYPRQMIQKTEKHLNEILIPVIKSKMREKDYSNEIIDSTRIGKIDVDMELGNISYEVISDYITTSNFDISTVREETGTVRHFIKARLKKALHFILRGVEFFSKGHWVKGIIASHIIADSMKELQPTIEKKLQDEADLLFERIMSVKL